MERTIDELVSRQDFLTSEIELVSFEGMFAPTSVGRMKAQTRLMNLKAHKAEIDKQLERQLEVG